MLQAIENVWAIGKKYPIGTSDTANISMDCSCLLSDTASISVTGLSNTTSVNQTLCLVS